MSSTNKTTYYELPQFISTDIPTWLGDFNGAMNADRADLASTSAGQAVNTANAAADAVGSLETSVTGLTTRVGSCEDVNTAQSTQISSLNTSVSGLDDRVTALEGGSAGGHSTGHRTDHPDRGHTADRGRRRRAPLPGCPSWWTDPFRSAGQCSS